MGFNVALSEDRRGMTMTFLQLRGSTEHLEVRKGMAILRDLLRTE